VSAAELPTEWIECRDRPPHHPAFPRDGTQSPVLQPNAYTADGKKLIVTTARGGIATITLATREVKPLVPVRVGPVAGHKTGDVLFTSSDCRAARPARLAHAIPPGHVYAANVDTGATREVVKLPPGRNRLGPSNARMTLRCWAVIGWRRSTAAGGNRAPGANARFGQPNYEAVGADGNP